MSRLGISFASFKSQSHSQKTSGRTAGYSSKIYCLILGSVIALTAQSCGSPGPSTPATDGPSNRILDPDAKAVLRWSVPDRYSKSWDAWTFVGSRAEDLGGLLGPHYDQKYVNPKLWSVVLDVVNSRFPPSLSEYHFRSCNIKVTGIGFSYLYLSTKGQCSVSLDNLPALGSYQVDYIGYTFKGESIEKKEVIKIKDHLVVVLGDSLASGEGNPDTLGTYELFYTNDRSAESAVDGDAVAFAWKDGYHCVVSPISGVRWCFTVKNVPVVWKDIRCRRSALSGYARFAEKLEYSDPHSSVTFLDYACSGAEIKHLTNTIYEGGLVDFYEGNFSKDDYKNNPIRSQIGMLNSDVGNSRRIDAVVISAGVNDLGFGDIVDGCASDGDLNRYNDLAPPCIYKSGILRKFIDLPGAYDKLATSLNENLSIKHTYITDYPAGVFLGGVCGTLSTWFAGIDIKEASWMQVLGRQLNIEISNAVIRATKKTPNAPWTFVQGLDSGFNDHPYCGGTNWFVKYEYSWKHQANDKGTAHPNKLGHDFIRDLLFKSIQPNLDDDPDTAVSQGILNNPTDTP